MNDATIFGVFGTILTSIIIFMLVREFVTWYTKQNEIVSLLKQIKTLIEINVENKPKTIQKSIESLRDDVKNDYDSKLMNLKQYKNK